MDHTTQKISKAGTANAKTTDFAYLGLSKEVLMELEGAKVVKSYQYSPAGKRLAMMNHKDTGDETSYYGYNTRTDVEMLYKPDGSVEGTYGYTAYGKEDKEATTGVDDPDATGYDPEKPHNVYRYSAKRWDPASKSYDMGFRNYSPGSNRFTSLDMYNGALADMGLSTSPWTNNRYGFAGGNPISNIELDGHRPVAELDNGGVVTDLEYDYHTMYRGDHISQYYELSKVEESLTSVPKRSGPLGDEIAKGLMGAIKSMEGRFDCHPGGSYALIYVTPCGNALEFDEDDLREHLVSGDSDKPWYTKRSGVNGRHEMNVFMKDTAGQINIVSMRQHPTVKGITAIDYQGPVREPDGKIVDWRNMKANGIPYTKTVYDPAIISTDQMMQWGKEAALDALNNGYSMTSQWTGTASNGLIIEGYARNGEVTTFYPKSW